MGVSMPWDTCPEPDCGRPIQARGYCQKHYQARYRKYGGMLIDAKPGEREHAHKCHACDDCYVPLGEAQELLAQLIKRYSGPYKVNLSVQESAVMVVVRLYADRHGESLRTTERMIYRLQKPNRVTCHVPREIYDKLWVLL